MYVHPLFPCALPDIPQGLCVSPIIFHQIIQRDDICFSIPERIKAHKKNGLILQLIGGLYDPGGKAHQRLWRNAVDAVFPYPVRRFFHLVPQHQIAYHLSPSPGIQNGRGETVQKSIQFLHPVMVKIKLRHTGNDRLFIVRRHTVACKKALKPFDVFLRDLHKAGAAEMHLQRNRSEIPLLCFG